jgi:hypothetical protein
VIPGLKIDRMLRSGDALAVIRQVTCKSKYESPARQGVRHRTIKVTYEPTHGSRK